MPIGFLTFYYLGALAIGYFTGYQMLLFGRRPTYGWERPSALRNGLNFVMLAALWLLAVAAPAWLYYQDFPRIQAGNSPALAQYTDEVLQALPPKGVIVLSDDAERLLMLEAACQRQGIANGNILIETASFSHREYLQDLAARYPDLKKVMTAPEKLRHVLPAKSLVYFLLQVGKQKPIYYLHPSFGYYFEVFYMEPHGVVYELKTFPNNTEAQPPLPSAAEIKSNQAFWKRMKDGPLQALPDLAKKSGSAQVLAIDYAAALDFWGVDLQRANRLNEASACFAEALRLNPDNFIAKANLDYNAQLQKNNHQPLDSTGILNKALAYYRGIEPVLKLNGPMDEPGLDLEIGQALAEGKNFRQANALFERRLQLLPGDPEAELAIAKTYVDAGDGKKALEELHAISNPSKVGSWELLRCEALAHVANKEYTVAETMFRDAAKADPKDASRLTILAEFYRVRGYDALQTNQPAEAAQRFNAALTNLDAALKILQAANAPETAIDEVPQLLLTKAELQMMLKSYDQAVTTLGQFLDLRASNPTALLNRAVAEVQLKKFAEAKKDYKSLRKVLPSEPYIADLGLADVAAAEKNVPEEIRYLKRYLKSAPDDTEEYGYVKKRLQKLEGH
jgi:tetratricopeptide (TPR) repeat protein